MAHLFQETVAKPRAGAAAVVKRRAPAGDFGARLAQAAAAAITEARDALTVTASSPPEAVHRLRKACKRWRALLRLLRSAIGDPADEMRLEARALMRELSEARNAQGALDALHDLAKGDPPIAHASFRTMRARLAHARDAAEATAVTPELRKRVRGYLDATARALELWNVPEIAFDTIADALTATYRRARKLVPENWHDVQAGDLHELRRRVVEHRYQIDAIEPLLPKRGRLLLNEAQRLRTHLGACQDITVLARFLEPHQPLAHWRSRLTPAIEKRRAAHMRTAERVARRLFSEKPKAFRKRIDTLRDARKNRKNKGD